jgi:LysR family transcriptional regulator, regulator for metE and metH
MDLEVRHLRLVVAIAETGSVTRAGGRLHLTQSALSHQLRDMEDRLGTRLFHRVGKRMVPTPAGEAVLRSASRVLDLLQRTEEDVRRSAGGRHGTVRIATECYTCYHWLPALLKEYRIAHPGIEVQVGVAHTNAPFEALLNGKLDVAIMSDRVRDRRVVSKPLFEDDMLVIVPPEHRLAERRFVRLEDFAEETLLVYPPKEESTVGNYILSRAGVAPAAIQEVALTEAIIELVKAGLGIAVLAEWAIAPYVRARSLCAIPLTARGYRRHWSAVVLRAMADAPHIRDFVAVLAKQSPSNENRARRPGLLRFDRPKHLSRAQPT